MKKPLPIYFVAAWCLFALFLTIGGTKNSLREYLSEGEAIEGYLKAFTGFVAILATWHVYLLVQLKSFNRWFSVVFFGWWTIALIWNGIAFLAELEQGHLRVLLVFIIPAVLNVVSIWYLVRRSFRAFAVQFVSEREKVRQSRLMQKAAQKRLKHDIRSMRS